MKKIDTALIGYDNDDQPFASLVFVDGTTQYIQPVNEEEWKEAGKQIATWTDPVIAQHFEREVSA